MASTSYLLLIALRLVHHLVSCVPQVALQSVSQGAEFLQSAPQPDVASPTTAGGGDAGSCDTCHIIADVAGLVWYSQVFLNTAATAVVNVGVGNGTNRATSTSFIQNEGAFTFNPENTANPGALTRLNFQPTATVGGALLTSPTAYNVFTAYSVTSAYMSNGICFTSSGTPTILSSAYSEILPSASGNVVLDLNGQQAFISFLGFTSCSGGGEVYKPTALIQVQNTTTTTTNTLLNVPLAEFSASLTIAPKSTPASASAGAITGGPSTTFFPSVGVPNIVVGNMTITPSPNPIALPIYSGSFIGTATNLGGGSSAIILPSSTIIIPSGGNFSSPPGAIEFLGTASFNRANAWLGVWGAAMMGLGALVFYL